MNWNTKIYNPLGDSVCYPSNVGCGLVGGYMWLGVTCYLRLTKKTTVDTFSAMRTLDLRRFVSVLTRSRIFFSNYLLQTGSSPDAASR